MEKIFILILAMSIIVSIGFALLDYWHILYLRNKEKSLDEISDSDPLNTF